MFGFPAHAPRLLATGVPDPGRTGLGSQLLQVPAAHQQKGQARMRSLPPEAAGTRAGRLLQRYGRLLALEEAAMEQDICRQGENSREATQRNKQEVGCG